MPEAARQKTLKSASPFNTAATDNRVKWLLTAE